MKIKRGIENNIFFYILPFLATLNIFETGSFLWLFFDVSTLIICLLHNNGISTKSIPVFDFVVYGLFSIAGILASVIFFGAKESIKAFVPILTFLAAAAVIAIVKDKKAFIKRFIFVLFLAYSIQIALLYFYNLSAARPGERTLISLWGDKLISVTVVAVLCSFVIGFSISKLFNVTKSLRCIFYTIPLSIVFLINIMTSTRTPFLVFAIALFFTFILYVFYTKKSVRNGVLLSVTSIVLIFGVVFGFNLFGIRTTIMSSSIVGRVEESGLNNGRGTIFINHLKSMNMSFFGGSVISAKYGFAHNIVQESYDLYGIFALIAIILIIFGFLRTLYLGIRKKDLLIFYIGPIYFAILPQLLSEPIIEGYPVFFWNIIFINTLYKMYLSKPTEEPAEENEISNN